MKRISTFLEDGQIEQLDKFAIDDQQTFASEVRRACDLYCDVRNPDSNIGAAISVALQVFDDAPDPEQAVRRIIMRWFHDREANSLHGGQTNIRAILERMEGKIDDIRRRR